MGPAGRYDAPSGEVGSSGGKTRFPQQGSNTPGSVSARRCRAKHIYRRFGASPRSPRLRFSISKSVHAGAIGMFRAIDLGETGWKLKSWGAILFRYQLQAAKFLTAKAFRLARISATFRRFLRSAASHGFDARCAAGAHSTPTVQPGGRRISLRTLRFLRLTGWPLLTALFSAAAKLKRLSNHRNFGVWRPYRGKQQHAHVEQFGERLLDHRAYVAPIQSAKPASKGRHGNRPDA